jgi:hypothetical protein
MIVSAEEIAVVNVTLDGLLEKWKLRPFDFENRGSIRRLPAGQVGGVLYYARRRPLLAASTRPSVRDETCRSARSSWSPLETIHWFAQPNPRLFPVYPEWRHDLIPILGPIVG